MSEKKRTYGHPSVNLQLANDLLVSGHSTATSQIFVVVSQLNRDTDVFKNLSNTAKSGTLNPVPHTHCHVRVTAELRVIHHPYNIW